MILTGLPLRITSEGISPEFPALKMNFLFSFSINKFSLSSFGSIGSFLTSSISNNSDDVFCPISSFGFSS